jgi:calcium-dependent protein kinase
MSSRVDVWDVQRAKDVKLDCGFRRQPLTEKYELGCALGEGGFGVVRIVRARDSGTEFACKTIRKRLDVPNLAAAKQQQHLDNIKREVAILRKLRGTLNVVYLEEAYEDDEDVHIVQELCRGGELFHRIGRRHYSEQTVRAAGARCRWGGGGGGSACSITPNSTSAASTASP